MKQPSVIVLRGADETGGLDIYVRRGIIMIADTAPMRSEIETRVLRFVHDFESSQQARHVLAIIVAGSACRGEEIWRDGHLVSDIDLMLVTRRTNPSLTRSLATFMTRFRNDGIDGGPTPLPSLQRYRTFAFYEAQANGIVVWGNYPLNHLLPRMAPNDLPRWEAVRVLANRMFEHLKLACGRKPPEHAVAKTYEALVEASLAWEGRYRPSYRERLAELVARPPALLSPAARSGAIGVLSARLGEGSQIPIPSAGTARRHLLAGLRDVLGGYLRADETVPGLLALLGRREFHLKHRAYWAVVRPRNAVSMLRTDPTIVLWQKAAVALQSSPASAEAKDLVDEWNACPSILRHHDPRYANGSAAHASH